MASKDMDLWAIFINSIHLLEKYKGHRLVQKILNCRDNPVFESMSYDLWLEVTYTIVLAMQ
jgi:hypothetical protein